VTYLLYCHRLTTRTTEGLMNVSYMSDVMIADVVVAEHEMILNYLCLADILCSADVLALF
jgi:hypothetical protein